MPDLTSSFYSNDLYEMFDLSERSSCPIIEVRSSGRRTNPIRTGSQEEKMKIHITARGISLTREQEEHVRRRLHFALGRFTNRVSRVRVRIADLNGPRGGVDTRCSIQVHLPRKSFVIVDELSSSVTSAVDVAADRAKRAVSRHIDRTLTRRRERPRAA